MNMQPHFVFKTSPAALDGWPDVLEPAPDRREAAAHFLIEELMIVTNQIVARRYVVFECGTKHSKLLTTLLSAYGICGVFTTSNPSSVAITTLLQASGKNCSNIFKDYPGKERAHKALRHKLCAPPLHTPHQGTKR